MADRAHWPDSPPGPDRSRVLSGGGMKLSIRHDTTYSYADEVCTSIQFLRLTPKDTQRQRILQWHLELPRLVRRQLDPYGNIRSEERRVGKECVHTCRSRRPPHH